MARPKKSEGTEVRHAMNGPDIDHDKMIGKIDKWNGEDRARASTAAETRGEIGGFVEQTGINAKALSFLRSIKKVAARDGGQAKAMDIIMSIEKGLPMVKADIGGQQAEMQLADQDAVTEADVEPEAAPVLARATYGDDGHLDDAQINHEYTSVADAEDELAGGMVPFEDNLAEVAE